MSNPKLETRNSKQFRNLKDKPIDRKLEGMNMDFGI